MKNITCEDPEVTIKRASTQDDIQEVVIITRNQAGSVSYYTNSLLASNLLAIASSDRYMSQQAEYVNRVVQDQINRAVISIKEYLELMNSTPKPKRKKK
jgi:hypothetical protein